MASLSLGGEIERSNVDSLVDNACTDNKFFCHTHLVTAAQYISAEMAMAGRRFSHFEDPTAWASTAYVTLADIPPHLVESFNEMKNNDNIVITERDVCTFLNNALRKYHGTPLWPERIEDRLNFDEGASGMISSGAAGLKEGATLLDALQASAKQFDGTIDASDTVCHPSPSFLQASHSEQKDPVTKGHYYLVKGEKLMQLFRFCPECGEKLRSTKLTAAGTAAIVEYELELWARQLKLSFLSKAAFLKMLEWTRPAAEDVYCNHLRKVEVLAYPPIALMTALAILHLRMRRFERTRALIQP
nr:unnamed protein product [Haemonchus contortus]